MTSANTLPEEIDALKALLRERDARIERLQDVVDSQEAMIAMGKAEIEHLKLLIAKLRRMQFGRKSERLGRQIEQLELRLGELEADERAALVEIPKATLTVPEQVPRRPSPEHLPRDVQTYLLKSGDKCLECGSKMNAGRRRCRTTRVRADKLPCDPLCATEVRLLVLRPHHTGSSTESTGRLWMYVRDDRTSADMTPPAVWFAYTPDSPQHLESFSGTLQADAYGDYRAIYEKRVTEAAC